MTVQSNLARIQYVVSGSGPYTIPFLFLDDADIVAYRQTPGNDAVLLSLTADYTVAGAGNESGGTLTLVSPLNGDTLTIINEPDILQLVDYPEVGKFPAASHETALDRLTIIAKRINDLSKRSLRLDDANPASELILPSPVDGQLIGWSDGVLVNTSPAGVGPNSIGKSELADTLLKAMCDLSTAADNGLYFTGEDTPAQFNLTAFARTLLDDANQTAALATLGALIGAVDAKTSTYTVVAADRGKLIDATSGTWTLNLTAAATLGNGFAFAVRNSGTGTITVDPSASEQIDGANTITLAAGESCLIVCDGTGWKTVGRARTAANVQTFNSDGTWTKPGTGSIAIIELWGAGGSGGRHNMDGGSGGAGGSYQRHFVPLSVLNASYPVTIGAGGAARSTNGDGASGGNSTFGSLVIAYGGGGGFAVYDSVTPGGTTLGAALDTSSGGAALWGGNTTTQAGGSAAYAGGGGGGVRGGFPGGTGGFSQFGGNGGAAGSVGIAGTAPGGGGGGGAASSGAGAAGRCVVTVF